MKTNIYLKANLRKLIPNFTESVVTQSVKMEICL